MTDPQGQAATVRPDSAPIRMTWFAYAWNTAGAMILGAILQRWLG